MSTALEYTVDAAGRVSSNGFYREITEEDWQTLRSVRQPTQARYGQALDAVAQGKIVAIAADSSKSAWSARRSIHLAAAKRGLGIESRRVRDPQVQKAELVLVRLRATADCCDV